MFMVSSIITQTIALNLFYPFDTIKVRMQTKNDIYKYENVFKAYAHIV